jgi:bifunctional non-homologous end joining protein LigD
MQATAVDRPFHRIGWVYEQKYDGWRLLAVKVAGEVQLFSRSGKDHTRRLKDLAEAVAALPAETIILDGQLVVFDQQHRSRWEWLRGAPPDALATPAMLMAFDVLQIGEEDIRSRPLNARRAVLEEAIAPARMILPARRLASNGLVAWREVEQMAAEGLVAKDDASPYVGGRSLSWRKVLRPESRGAVAKRFGR